MIPFYKSQLVSDPIFVEKLELQFASYTGFKYGIAVDSCTSAIKLCLEYEKPRVVGIPAMTYVSVAEEIIHAGAKLNLLNDYAAGYAYQLMGTDIWDSAHEVTFGVGIDVPAEVKYCYSFYPTKLVPSYQGGMICTNDLKFATWARVARQMGRTAYGAHYDVPIIGWKCNMTPIQALIALDSLEKLDKTKDNLYSQVERYNKAFRVGLPIVKGSCHLYVILVDSRDEFIRYMEANGVQCSIHFKPIYRFHAFTKYGKPKDFSYCESIADKIVSLPLYPGLLRSEQNKIIKLVNQWDKQNLRMNIEEH